MKITQARSVLLEPVGKGLSWWSGFSIRKTVSSSAASSLRRVISSRSQATMNRSSLSSVGGGVGMAGQSKSFSTAPGFRVLLCGESGSGRPLQGQSAPKAMPSILATSTVPRASLVARPSVSQPLLSALLAPPSISTKRHLSTTLNAIVNPNLMAAKKDSPAVGLHSRHVRPTAIKKRAPRKHSFTVPVLASFTTDATSRPKSTTRTIEKDRIPTLKNNKKFGFPVSAAYSAKSGHMQQPHAFSFNPHHHVTPNLKASWLSRKKARPATGQDAFFVSRVNEVGGIALGVADGVGGYIHSGIDSADFSHTLCEHMSCMAQQANPMIFHPRTLLNAAYQRLIEGQEVPGGASTACVGIARPDGVLTVANLGDSGYVIFRDGKVLHSSSPQTHAFNTPYQLSVIPPKLLEQSRTFGGDFLCDLPKDAAVTTHNLVHGDVVIFATDGLWDNLSTQQILRIVCQEMIGRGGWANRESVEGSPNSAGKPVGIHASKTLETLTETDGTGLQTVLASAIAAKAKSMSLSNTVDGPFAKEVKRLMPQELWYDGGKKDDICVVCLVVVEPERLEPRDKGKLKPKSLANQAAAAATAGATTTSTTATATTNSSLQSSSIAKAPRNVA